MKDLKNKVKNAIKELKEKKRSKKEAEAEKEKKVAIGPRGGKYISGKVGDKEYVKKGEDSMKKALTAGYEEITPENPGEEVENIEAAASLEKPTEEPKEASVEPEKEEVSTEPEAEQSASEEPKEAVNEPSEVPKEEEPKAKPKFAGNLFNHFSLGSTLNHAPEGVSLNNIRPSKYDKK